MKNGAVIVKGRVLDVDHRSGTTTKGQPYSFHIVSVLTGKAVSEVRWPESVGVPPREDETLEVVVSLDTFNGRLQIEAQERVASGARVAAAS